jgi:hypothetical protein
VTDPAGASNPNKAPEPRYQPSGNRVEYNEAKHKRKIKDLDCDELEELLKDYLYKKGHGGGSNRGLMDRRQGMLEDAAGIGYKTGAPHQPHVDQYYAQQQRAQDVIDKMDEDGCNPPPNMREDAKKEAPTYEEFQEWQAANNSSRTWGEWAYDNRWEIAGGAAVAGAAAATWYFGGAGGAAVASMLGIGGGAAMATQCLAPETRVSTPSGEVPIASLRVGDAVVSSSGAVVRVVAIGRRVVSSQDELLALSLSSGRRLHITPDHPLADGRRAGDLSPGDTVGGLSVVEMTPVRCGHGELYDILPGGDASYLAEGAPVTSSAARPARRAIATRRLHAMGRALACHP